MPVKLTSPIMGPFRVGMRNDGVRLVQERLNEVLTGTPGFMRLGTDGALGSKTEAAIIRFQKSRQLRADGVVGPITAKALGFTHYTSLQRMAAGAMELASVVTGSIARWVPPPHAELNPTYNMLAALAVHASVMRRTFAALGGIPGVAGPMQEVDRIAAALERQLAMSKANAMLDSMRVSARAHADSTHAQLSKLSKQLHVLAGKLRPTPNTQSPLAELALLQARLLNAHLLGMQALSNVHGQADADELLRIAAQVVKATNRLVPKP